MEAANNALKLVSKTLDILKNIQENQVYYPNGLDKQLEECIGYLKESVDKLSQGST